jgi:hypothetical protein
MSDDVTAPPAEVVPPTPAPQPTIHEAQRASGPSGIVERGVELTFEEAVTRRGRGEDVVVCGDETDANRRLAGQVEAAVGARSRPQAPEWKAGPRALPHFHQESRDPDGHTFYETEKRKARKRK